MSGEPPDRKRVENEPMAASRYSLIVPCKDEVESLPALAERVQALRAVLADRGDVEVVLIDDGSVDDTAREARRLFEERGPFVLLRHPTNRGLGAAFASGIRAASGQIIGTLDADGSYDPALMEELFARVENGADVATASPYHPRGRVAGVTPLRLLLSRGVSLLYSMLLPGRLFTYTSCFRAYRAEVAREVSPEQEGFGATAEMLCRALLAGRRVAEVPATLATRRHGVSKLRPGREIVRHLRTLFQILLRRGPYTRARREHA